MKLHSKALVNRSVRKESFLCEEVAGLKEKSVVKQNRTNAKAVTASSEGISVGKGITGRWRGQEPENLFT